MLSKETYERMRKMYKSVRENYNSRRENSDEKVTVEKVYIPGTQNWIFQRKK
jgi:hypothetical protein